MTTPRLLMVTVALMRCRLAEIPQIGVRRGGLDGAGTFELHVVAPDLEAYSRWAMEMLSKLPNVKDMQTRFSLKEVKADGAWPLGQLERR